MYLYLVERVDDADYDEMSGFVVRAKNTVDARAICAKSAGDEGTDVWLNREKSIVKLLRSNGRRGVILSDFLTS